MLEYTFRTEESSIGQHSNRQPRCVTALLASVGMSVPKVSGLFKLMDLDNSGEVSVDEFLLQCMRLKGNAKSVDLMSLMYENVVGTDQATLCAFSWYSTMLAWPGT